MIIKKSPMDFVVKENLSIKLKPAYSRGFPYAVYILKKTGLETGEVVKIISKRLRVLKADIKLSGLKDKDAVTYQYISVKGRCPPEVKLKNIELVLKGYSDKPLAIGTHVSNTFEITMRELSSEQINRIRSKKVSFMPNYFGDQRFGSVRFFHDSNDFMMKHAVQGHFWDAIKVYLTRFTPDDNFKQAKITIKEHWKDLKACPMLPVGEYSKLVDILKNTSNPLTALKHIDETIMKMAIYAYQSFLWNETLKSYIKEKYKYKSTQYICGHLYFPSVAVKEEIEIPILNYKSEIPSAVKDAVHEVLNKEGITQEQLRTKVFGNSFFSTSMRKGFVRVSDFKVKSFGKDHVTVSFSLPKGAYATVFVDGLMV
ncbi:MAG: tRNA pseudouridine(13) synthase TruD [Nanoarchaeota archaeon]|nr:tRNA pseudouridine(13) synthase TruD [Nanoarchaeota archaeon]MBU1703948.1 tRNA pseudouridine(13) synthase TruD [Nanoarchaeota archaeon]